PLPSSPLFPYTTLFRSGDARLLLFPVRSLNGVFAYTTSYDLLNRFKRDIEREPKAAKLDWIIPEAVKDQVLVTTNSEVHYDNTRSEEHTSELQSPCNLV